MSSNHSCAPEDLRKALLSISKSCKLSATPVIFRQGDPAKGVYLVESGSVKLSLEGERHKSVYERTMRPGALLGLPATINDAPYSATATAAEDTLLAFVSREELLELMRRDPAVAMTVLKMLSQEIHEMRGVIKGTKRAPEHKLSESVVRRKS